MFNFEGFRNKTREDWTQYIGFFLSLVATSLLSRKLWGKGRLVIKKNKEIRKTPEKSLGCIQHSLSTYRQYRRHKSGQAYQNKHNQSCHPLLPNERNQSMTPQLHDGNLPFKMREVEIQCSLVLGTVPVKPSYDCKGRKSVKMLIDLFISCALTSRTLSNLMCS